MTKLSEASRSTGLWWWVLQTASWMLLVTIVALLVAMIGIPKATGATPYTVLTGSMRPTMPPGSLVVTKPVDADKLSVGDAITYQLRSGEPAVVTHRIISIAQTLGGEILFTTQGDANPHQDEKPVKAGQIRGVVWYSIPFAGYLNSLLTGEQRSWIVGSSVVLLIGYAACMGLGAMMDARKAARRTGDGRAKVNAL